MQPVFFAYIKDTEGATVKDKTFDIRMIEAERHGIVKGAYHFLRLGSPIEDQIKNFRKPQIGLQEICPRLLMLKLSLKLPRTEYQSYLI